MQFGEADRKLIRAMAKNCEGHESRIKDLEALVLKPEVSPVKMGSTLKHVQSKKSAPESLFGGPINGDHTIEVIFKDKQGDDVKQRILIESLYKTLKELCTQNGIDTLQIRIKN